MKHKVFIVLLFLPLAIGRICDVTIGHPSGSDDSSLFETAFQQVSAIRATQTTSKPLVICLTGSKYYLSHSLDIGLNDSGTSSSPTIITSRDNLRISSIHGSIPIPRLLLDPDPTLASRGILSASLAYSASSYPFMCPTNEFSSLFVRGERRTVSRYPNVGWLTLYPFTYPLSLHCDDTTKSQGYKSFVYDSSVKSKIESIPDLTTGRVVNVIRWEQPIAEISGIIPFNNTITTSRASGRMFGCDYEEGSPFYIENILSELDSPGEFYFSSTTKKIYYKPMSGETIDSLEGTMELASLNTIIDLNGTSYVQFERVGILNSAWSCPSISSKCDGQSSAFQKVGAITIKNAHDCSFVECIFSGSGFYTFHLISSRSITVSNSRFDSLASGAFRIDTTTSPTVSQHVIFSDNIVTRYGIVFRPASGVLIQKAKDVSIIHNEISDGYYTAIGIGWSWGFSEDTNTGNLNISFNHLHHIGKRIMSDLAAVYSLGIQAGTVVSNNVVHDVTELSYGGWGLYADEGSTWIQYYGNIVWGCDDGSWFVHYGSNLTIRQNLFWSGIYGAIKAADRFEHRKLLDVSCNVLVSDRPGNPFYYGSTVFNLNSSWNSFDKQVFLSASNATKKDTRPHSNYDIGSWNSRGFDQNSILLELQQLAKTKANPNDLLKCFTPENCKVENLVSAVTEIISSCDYSPIVQTIKSFGPRSFVASTLVLFSGDLPNGNSTIESITNTIKSAILPGGFSHSTPIPKIVETSTNDTTTFETFADGTIWRSSIYSLSGAANFAVISSGQFLSPHAKSLCVTDFTNLSASWQPLLQRNFAKLLSKSTATYQFDVFLTTINQKLRFETRSDNARTSPNYETGIYLDFVLINNTHITITGPTTTTTLPVGWIRLQATEENSGLLGWGLKSNLTHTIKACTLKSAGATFDEGMSGCISTSLVTYSEKASSSYFSCTTWMGWYFPTNIQGSLFLDNIHVSNRFESFSSANVDIWYTDESQTATKEITLFKSRESLVNSTNKYKSNLGLVKLSGDFISNNVSITVRCGIPTNELITFEFVELVKVHSQPTDYQIPNIEYNSVEDVTQGHILAGALLKRGIRQVQDAVLSFDANVLGEGTFNLQARCLYHGLPAIEVSKNSITLIVKVLSDEQQTVIDSSDGTTSSDFNEQQLSNSFSHFISNISYLIIILFFKTI